MENETQIIRRCLNGDDGAFSELVEQYRERAFWVAYGKVGDRDVARDITQQAFLRVYKSLDQFDLDRSFSPWFYQILRNLCVDWHRKNDRRPDLSMEHVGTQEGGNTSPDAETHNQEIRERVHDVLKELPEKYRLVLTLREFEDMDCKDIAEVVDCNYDTVRWRIHRARQLFKDAWKQKCEKSDDAMNPLMNENH
jgi:RNA polymerase sigma-70 factor (ECF subfamily)